MRAVKTRRLLALLFVVPLLAACGGEDEPRDAADDPTPEIVGEPIGSEACDLLTVDEISDAVGVDVEMGVGNSSVVATGGSQKTCLWRAVDQPLATATLTVYTDASAADSVKDADSLPLPEVGDDAFIGSFASVWAYAGEGSFMVQWYDVDGSDEENLPKSIALAQLVLERL